MASQPPELPPPIEARLIINFRKGGIVEVDWPKDLKITGLMLGEAIKMILQQAEFKEPSPIIQVAPGTRLQ
jgi:hypothetical protein